MPTVHIESKKEDIAPRVLMPGDPNRAHYIAEKYLENARLVNKVRGELAYTGTYKGVEVTILVWEYIVMNFLMIMMLNKSLE